MMCKVINLDSVRPRIEVRSFDEDNPVDFTIPPSWVDELIAGTTTFDDLYDGDMIMRSIIKEWLQFKGDVS